MKDYSVSVLIVLWRVLSQIAIGEFNKVGDKTVQVFVKVGGDDKQKLVIGNLSQKVPQVYLDLLFEQDFEVSHECKSSSVYLLGYKTVDTMDGELNSGEFHGFDIIMVFYMNVLKAGS